MWVDTIHNPNCHNHSRVWFWMYPNRVYDTDQSRCVDPSIFYPRNLWIEQTTNSLTNVYQQSNQTEKTILDHYELQESSFGSVIATCVHCKYSIQGSCDDILWHELSHHFISGQCAWIQMCFLNPLRPGRVESKKTTLEAVSKCKTLKTAWLKAHDFFEFESERDEIRAYDLMRSLFPDPATVVFLSPDTESFLNNVHSCKTYNEAWKLFCDGVQFAAESYKNTCSAYFKKIKQ